MAAAGTHDIVIDQGATWQLNVTWQDSTGTGIDLSGASISAQVRTAPADEGGDVLADMALESLLLPNDTGISVQDAAAGDFLLQISSDDTEGMPAGSWHWDVEVTISSQTTRLLMGRAVVRAEVTRAS